MKKEKLLPALIPTSLTTDGETEAQVQLELLPSWFSKTETESRTLDFFDAIPKYPYYRTTTVDKPTRIEATFKVGDVEYCAEIVNAQIKDRATGQEKLVFPGAREELVERALRYIAVQQRARTRVQMDQDTNEPSITVYFTLSMLRRALEETGHGYKCAEIAEALEILNATFIEVSPKDKFAAEGTLHTIRSKETILSKFVCTRADNDPTGDLARYKATFHSRATQAILNLGYYQINFARIASLKGYLSRWLANRMIHNFRQAERLGYMKDRGYSISLRRIIEERGMVQQPRIRDNIRAVEVALEELKTAGFLFAPKPHDEKITTTKPVGRGRPSITGVTWTLYPSTEIVAEIIEGNQARKRARDQAEAVGGQNGFPGLMQSSLPLPPGGPVREKRKNTKKPGGRVREKRQKPGDGSAKLPER